MDCENCGGTFDLDDREPPVSGLCWPCASVALDKALEVFAPFYLHGMALRGTVLPENATINRVGSSYLVKGAFESAIEFFQKYGTRKSASASCCLPHTPGMSCSCGCHSETAEKTKPDTCENYRRDGSSEIQSRFCSAFEANSQVHAPTCQFFKKP